MTEPRRIPPPWLLGWGNLPVAVSGSVGLIAVPDLLAAAHVPEAQIAIVTSLYIAAGFIGIPLSPILDWRFSRRTYAIVLTSLGTLCQFGALISIHNTVLLGALLFIGGLSMTMAVGAAGGWFGDLVPARHKDSLGAWFTAVNFGFGGAVAALIVYLTSALPYPFGEAASSGLTLLVLPLFVLTPCPPADRALASESFGRFARAVTDLLMRKDVQWVLVFFLAPSASFALTNTLSGFGRYFHTSTELVGVIGGVGVSLAGVTGSLLVPPLTKRIAPVILYLMVGLVGAAFTFSLIPASRDSVVFGIAVLGQNLFQAAALSAAAAITFRTIDKDKRFAATQFTVLIGVTQIPLTYMQMIDGRAFDLGGVSATFLADALISGSACVLLGILYRRANLKAAPELASPQA